MMTWWHNDIMTWSFADDWPYGIFCDTNCLNFGTIFLLAIHLLASLVIIYFSGGWLAVFVIVSIAVLIMQRKVCYWKYLINTHTYIDTHSTHSCLLFFSLNRENKLPSININIDNDAWNKINNYHTSSKTFACLLLLRIFLLGCFSLLMSILKDYIFS